MLIDVEILISNKCLIFYNILVPPIVNTTTITMSPIGLTSGNKKNVIITKFFAKLSYKK